MYATQTQESYNYLVTDECLTQRRLPIRNSRAEKQSDGSYVYIGVRWYSRSTLIKRGWNDDLIKQQCGDADALTINPYNVNSPLMELWDAKFCEYIENKFNIRVLSVEEALKLGHRTVGIKVTINTFSFAGVYTSNGRGDWNPTRRNKRQQRITTANLEFWRHEGFPIVVNN